MGNVSASAQGHQAPVGSSRFGLLTFSPPPGDSQSKPRDPKQPYLKHYNDTFQQAQNCTTFKPSPLLDPLQFSQKGASPRKLQDEDSAGRAREHQIAIRFAIANIPLIATRSSIAIILRGRNLIASSSHGSTTIAIRNLIADIPSGNQQTESWAPRGQSLQQLPQGSFQRGAPPRQCQPFLPFRPRFPFAVQVQGSERLRFFWFAFVTFCHGPS